MIKRFLYVEDGSVDVDLLEEELAEDTKIIVYRQGSTPPIMAEPKEPVRDVSESVYERKAQEVIKLKKYLNELINHKKPFDFIEELKTLWEEFI